MSAEETCADTVHRLVEITGVWVVDANKASVTKFYERWSAPISRHFKIVGTSGSHDYLKDSPGNQRFWSVYTPTTIPADVTNTDDDPPCDGNHDTTTSLLSPCTRCFPYARDTQRDVDEHEDDEIQQDEDQDHQEPP